MVIAENRIFRTSVYIFFDNLNFDCRRKVHIDLSPIRIIIHVGTCSED